ncbi:hypothetical protein BT67DRAFT_137117 [Trichocladium antarcticum]|uniref:Uncharacterized protein n=1 Tax=Trichocladium antarcticum TaxID=1450529 RepID=A0AAN6UF60_9PEZI|nr:hypothetical protein BT67DRAFT_137117 [Trichocladium antarcticum]
MYVCRYVCILASGMQCSVLRVASGRRGPGRARGGAKKAVAAAPRHWLAACCVCLVTPPGRQRARARCSAPGLMYIHTWGFRFCPSIGFGSCVDRRSRQLVSETARLSACLPALTAKEAWRRGLANSNAKGRR